MIELLNTLFELLRHTDTFLENFVKAHGGWTYLLLCSIIFAETGLVFAPFLPGDSLLFMAGAIAGRDLLNHGLVFGLLAAAAIIGDNVNYWVGRFLGQTILSSKARWIHAIVKPKYLERTHEYFARYGPRTIIIARFVPIVRTLSPFVAGLGRMNYGRFLAYDVFGGFLWVGICVYAGVFFGQLEFVKQHFEMVVLAIIFISILPAIFEYFRHRRALQRAAGQPPQS